MVYYRKYRPQSLEELIGQSLVRETLKKAFQSGKLAHAYLFCGPKGTGKTSTARILAKMVNCESTKEPIPCNECQTCQSITDGSNLDLIEIDAASNRGIDDIRELRDRINLAPTASKKKVYIIDEVHMLTNEAFNALLKTLEEPPAHVLFILATTEVHKIPQTILSRVQKLDFKLANFDDLLELVKKAAQKEKLDIEEQALELISKRSEGSFRDSLKLLDQLASKGEKISLEMVEQNFSAGRSEDLTLFLEALATKNAQKGLEILEKQLKEGINLKEFTLTVLESLRTLLLSKHKKLSSDLAEQFTSSDLIKLIDSFLKALEQMKFTSIPSLPLEVAIIESCLVGSLVQSVEPKETEFKGNSETIKLTQVVQENVIPSISEESPTDVGISNKLRDSSSSTQNDNKTTDDVASTDMLVVKDKWTYILETIKPYNYSLEALLKQVKILNCEGGVLTLEVPYSFHQRILEAPKSRDLLESVLSDVLGKSAKVSCVLGKRPVRVEELANVELAQDDEVIRVAAEIFSSES